MTDILLVEDQDCVREVLADLLMDAGLEVAEAPQARRHWIRSPRAGHRTFW